MLSTNRAHEKVWLMDMIRIQHEKTFKPSQKSYTHSHLEQTAQISQIIRGY